MPNIASAIKQVKKSERNRLRNKSYKSAMRTQLKKFLQSIEDENVEVAKTEFPKTMQILDKIGHRNIMHMNNVSRKKAALHVKYNALLAQAKATPSQENKEKEE